MLQNGTIIVIHGQAKKTPKLLPAPRLVHSAD
jgi:hypothetical protein